MRQVSLYLHTIIEKIKDQRANTLHPRYRLEIQISGLENLQDLIALDSLLLLLSHFSFVQLLRPHRRQPTRLPHPWDSPGKNTGVGCHFLLQCMKVKSESEVARSRLTLCNPMDCSLPGSSIHGIFQARVLEWGDIAFSDWTLYLYLFSSATGQSWGAAVGFSGPQPPQPPCCRQKDFFCIHFILYLP